MALFTFSSESVFSLVSQKILSMDADGLGADCGLNLSRDVEGTGTALIISGATMAVLSVPDFVLPPFSRASFGAWPSHSWPSALAWTSSISGKQTWLAGICHHYLVEVY